MSWSTKLTLILSVVVPTSSLLAAEDHGVASAAEPLFHVLGLPITNSIVTSWIVAAVLLILIRVAIRRPQLVPTRGQAVVESLVQGVLDLTSPIVGPKVAPHTFPLLVGLFIFILTQNWSGLFPGVGTVYMRDHASGGWTEFVRPGNADMNLTIALSLVSFVAWLYFILRYAGPKAVLYDLFGNKADRKEIPAFIYYFLFVIFFAVGLIEIVSIMFRPVSLSFRLFGNVYGGENLMHAMSSMYRWGLPIPFYFLEVLIGFVQALVFTLLVSVYIGLMCNHGDEPHDEGAHGGKVAAAHH
jgi:F-type H+-transporting ATPase subunit a